MKEKTKKQVKPKTSVKPKKDAQLHVQKSLHKEVLGQVKFLVGYGKLHTRPARGKKNIVRNTKEKKLDIDRGEWF